LKELGTDVSESPRTQLTEEILAQNFDRVIVMSEPQHIPEWLSTHPNYIYWNVNDPKDQNIDYHRQIRDQIKENIENNISLFR
jgi:protein-tyrosine-phosphatase